MTKEITKAFILQEIAERFALRELAPEKFSFSEIVVPTYDVESHLGLNRISVAVLSITGTGGVDFFVVPDNENWILSGYNVVFSGAGTCTISGVYITRRPVSTSFLYLDLTAAQNTSYAVNLPKEILLKAGDTVSVNVDGYTATANLYLYIDVLKETVR